MSNRSCRNHKRKCYISKNSFCQFSCSSAISPDERSPYTIYLWNRPKKKRAVFSPSATGHVHVCCILAEAMIPIPLFSTNPRTSTGGSGNRQFSFWPRAQHHWAQSPQQQLSRSWWGSLGLCPAALWSRGIRSPGPGPFSLSQGRSQGGFAIALGVRAGRRLPKERNSSPQENVE